MIRNNEITIVMHNMDEFIKKVNEFINIIMVYGYFNSGIIKVLVMNNKFIYLWQNAKGEINYSFNLSVKEFHTTSITRLGNVLSRHFECNVEVVNNTKEHLKKMISATGGLNKALADSDRYNSFAGYNRATEIQSLPYSNNGGFTANDDILGMLNSNSTHFPPLAHHQVNLNINQQNPWHNQEKNHQGIIQLSTYYLEAHINTTYIKIDELFIVHEERYSPSIQHTFYTDPNGVNCKNTYIPTKWMIFTFPLNEPSQSFILKLIFFMAKKDIAQAFKILTWIVYVFWHIKLPYALVLEFFD